MSFLTLIVKKTVLLNRIACLKGAFKDLWKHLLRFFKNKKSKLFHGPIGAQNHLKPKLIGYYDQPEVT